MIQINSSYKLVFVLIIYFVLFFISLNGLLAENIGKTELEYKVPKKLDSFSISSEKIKIQSSHTFPEFVDREVDNKNWRHISRNKSEKKLAGINGNVIIDMFENENIKLTREFWISIDNNEIATRQKITNKTKGTIRLKNLYPLNLKGINGLVFQNQQDTKKWNVLYQQRLKNGQPATIVPSKSDTVIIDPFSVFHVNDKDTPDLLIGYLSQTGHLAEFSLVFEKTNGEVVFSSLKSKCEFDGIILPDGAERASQWTYIKAGFDPNELVAQFANRVGEYHGVKRPDDKAPSVFCTWYFHGREYNEEFLLNDLKSLKEDHIPFDVFLIDDCWSTGDWGYWRTTDAFPSGMAKIAQEIKKNGYKPGIWTAPYSVEKQSALAKEHPEWLLKTTADTLVIFCYATKAWILDPTYPGVTEHIEEVFRRLKNDYGFLYFKLDFMRSVFVFDNIKFFDPTKTRLEAFRMGLEAVRRGVGPDSYISVCGGHFGGSLGLANSQRSGSDVVSMWEPKQVFTFRQNILRTWMSRLWHVDPDALMIRKRQNPYHDPASVYSKLALGKLTDEEALTFTLNQYVGGGMVCFSEYMPELQQERKELYKHIIPSIDIPSTPIDLFNPFIPAQMLTKVTPVCDDLKQWNTVAIFNLTEKDTEEKVILSDKILESLTSNQFIISEFFSNNILGIFSRGETVNLGIVHAHHSKLLRIAQWDGDTPVLAGTDLHFSGGGVEIETWEILTNGSIKGKLNTDWVKPVKLTVAYPTDNEKKYKIVEEVVSPMQKLFYISNK